MNAFGIKNNLIEYNFVYDIKETQKKYKPP